MTITSYWKFSGSARSNIWMKHSTVLALDNSDIPLAAYIVNIANSTNSKVISILHWHNTTRRSSYFIILTTRAIKPVYAVRHSAAWRKMTSFWNRYFKTTSTLSVVRQFKPKFTTTFPYKALFEADLVIHLFRIVINSYKAIRVTDAGWVFAKVTTNWRVSPIRTC